MRINTDQLWVVEYNWKAQTQDISMPEEVFTTRESADEYCAYLNTDNRTNLYTVHIMSDRLGVLRENLLMVGSSY